MADAILAPSAHNVNQVWMPVIGHEGFYEVSCDGIVRSVDRKFQAKTRWGSKTVFSRRGFQLKPYLVNGGYLVVRLRSGKAALVHRLVANACLGGPPTMRQVVNHKNGIKTDNRVCNLEWVTPRKNTLHAVQNCLHPVGDRNGSRVHIKTRPWGESHVSAKLTEQDVVAIRARRGVGHTLRTIASDYGVSIQIVSAIANRKVWKHI